MVTSKVLLQSSVPARLWNMVSTDPGYFLVNLCLDIDMGKHAPGDRILQLEGIDYILERFFHRGDALYLAVHGVGPDNDIAGRIGKCVKRLPDNVIRDCRWVNWAGCGRPGSLLLPFGCPAGD